MYKLEDHLERLEYSAKADTAGTPLNREEFKKAVCDTCKINELRNGYVRLVVTRGDLDISD